MRTRRLFLVVMVSVVAILLGRAEVSFSRDRLHQFTMENGIKVILEENRATPVVALQVWVKAGSADERDEGAGMCHFVLGFLGASFQHPDSDALRVLEAALSGQGGRLFRELRDKESLAYALIFMAQPNLDRGFIGVYKGDRSSWTNLARNRS